MSIHEYNVVSQARLSRGESESLAWETKYNVGFEMAYGLLLDYSNHMVNRACWSGPSLLVLQLPVT